MPQGASSVQPNETRAWTPAVATPGAAIVQEGGVSASTRTAGSMLRPDASLRMLCRLRLRWPRSTWPTNVQCRPQRLASAHTFAEGFGRWREGHCHVATKYAPGRSHLHARIRRPPEHHRAATEVPRNSGHLPCERSDQLRYGFRMQRPGPHCGWVSMRPWSADGWMMGAVLRPLSATGPPCQTSDRKAPVGAAGLQNRLHRSVR